MNNKLKPLDDKRVRQALSYATDRETMIAIAYEGLASPTYLMANTSSFGVPKDKFRNHYEYNLEKAKALLAEAGYPNGLDLGVMTVIIVFWCIDKRCGYFMLSLGFLGTVLNQFLKILFRIPRPWVLDPSFEPVESAVADAEAHNYVLCTMGGGFMTDFAYAVGQYYVPTNMANYENPKVTELAEKAAGETNAQTRLKLYEEISDIVIDECPNIPIFNKQVPWVWAKDLNAVPHLDSGRCFYIYEMSWKQ